MLDSKSLFCLSFNDLRLSQGLHNLASINECNDSIDEQGLISVNVLINIYCFAIRYVLKY